MKTVVALVLLSACSTQPAPDAIRAAFERGYWAGWRQHAMVIGGGL